MGSKPSLASRSEVVLIYKCPTKISGPSPKKYGAQKTSSFLLTFLILATSALNTAYLRNETSNGQTKMLLSIYNVSLTRWPTFCDLWPRNGWDPFAYCDATFVGYYVATIKFATSLTHYAVVKLHVGSKDRLIGNINSSQWSTTHKLEMTKSGVHISSAGMRIVLTLS